MEWADSRRHAYWLLSDVIRIHVVHSGWGVPHKCLIRRVSPSRLDGAGNELAVTDKRGHFNEVPGSLYAIDERSLASRSWLSEYQTHLPLRSP